MKNLTKVMECKNCHQKVTVELVRNITGSGTSQIFWRCVTCQKNANGPAQFITHKKVVDSGLIAIEEIPINQDNRIERCAVCGALGAEYHHWAPRHLFHDDADLWPGAWLCNKHHTLWHRMVTPLMSAFGKIEAQNGRNPLLQNSGKQVSIDSQNPRW